MNKVTLIGYLAKNVEVKTLNNEKKTQVANVSLCDTQTIGARKNSIWFNLEGYGTKVAEMTPFQKQNLVKVTGIIQKNTGYVKGDGHAASLTLKVLGMEAYTPKAKAETAAPAELPLEEALK